MSDTPRSPVFTIGHSNHPLEKFLALLERHGVNQAVDVRSTPFSRFAPQFNRKNLAVQLGRARMEYAFLGPELGGRPADPAHYDENGRARYNLMAETPAFQRGTQEWSGKPAAAAPPCCALRETLWSATAPCW